MGQLRVVSAERAARAARAARARPVERRNPRPVPGPELLERVRGQRAPRLVALESGQREPALVRVLVRVLQRVLVQELRRVPLGSAQQQEAPLVRASAVHRREPMV